MGRFIKKVVSWTYMGRFKFNDLYILCVELNLICQGKPRPNIVWYKDGRELYGHRYLHVSKSLVVKPNFQSITIPSSVKHWVGNIFFRSASSGVASTVSSRRWRSTRQRRGTLGSTSATLTTSNLSLFNSYIAQSLIHLLFEQKCPLPCTVIQVLDRHAILPVRLQILNWIINPLGKTSERCQ